MGQILATVKDFFAGILDGILREGEKQEASNNSSRNVLKKNIEGENKLSTEVTSHLTQIKREKQEASDNSSTNVLKKNIKGENKLTYAGSPTVFNVTEETKKKKNIWIKHYCSAQKILLVGEGDFSFSASLANAFGSAVNMVATSLDSIGFLARNYGKAMSNISNLNSKGCIVLHEFDATEMADFPILHARFDRIIYNFPLAGFFLDKTRELELKIHQDLVRMFMVNARKLLKKDGEIHITHKSYGFFLEWNLESLGRNNGLVLIDDVPFDLNDYPGYNTKYGFGGDKNFDCESSRTYMFRLKTPSHG